MKRMLFALLCILGASFVQAVTTSWTWDSERDGSTITGTRGDSSNPLTGTYTNFSLVASFTLSADVIASNVTLFNLSGQGADANKEQHIKLYVEGGDLKVEFFGQAGTGFSDVVTSDVQAGKYVFAFSRGEDRQQGQMRFSLNGGDVAFLHKENTFASAGEMESLVLNGGSMTGFTLYGGTMTDEELSQYSVPEPTALALLALGVAGLALRRRVA